MKRFLGAIFSAIIIMLPIVIGYYGVTMGHIYWHEEAHVSIFEAYEIPAEYHVDFITMSGYTYPTNMTAYDLNCGMGSDCRELNEMNEIMGYNIAIIIDLIFMVGGMLLVILWLTFLMLGSTLKYLRMNFEVIKENG